MKIFGKAESKRSKTAAFVIAFFCILLLIAMGWTISRNIAKGIIILDELFVEVVALFVILKSAVAQYTYLLTEDKLVIVEKIFFYTTKMEIPYNMIDGVYAHKTEFISKFRLRYKYRKCSIVDNRPIWALIYSIVNGKKIKNGRVLLKADPAFFEAFDKFVPNRICAPQADVMLYSYARRDAVMHDESVEEYFKKLSGDSEDSADTEGTDNTSNTGNVGDAGNIGHIVNSKEEGAR